jgi:Holliday junction resolvase
VSEYYPTESAAQAAIIEYLQMVGAIAIRVNSGQRLIQNSDGTTHMFKGAEKGTSDVIALYHGVFLAVECKKNARAKRTPEQIEFINRVNEAGGVGLFAWSTEQVQEVIERIGK